MPRIEAVIFDMYETLVHNDHALWIRTFDEICEEQELSLRGQELWDRWRAIERGFRRERTNLDDPEKSPPFRTYEWAWGNAFREVFREIGKGDPGTAASLCVAETGRREPFPETAEAMNQLRASGRFRMAVLSNSDNDALNPLLLALGLNFDAVLSSESARMYKPDPRIFRQILDVLGVEASSSLYVGDSQADDVRGAKFLGMQAAWINRNGTQLDPALPAPDYVVGNLLELLDILGVSREVRSQ